MAGCFSLIGGIPRTNPIPTYWRPTETMPDLRVFLGLTIGGYLVS